MKALIPIFLFLALAFVPATSSADTLDQYVLHPSSNGYIGASWAQTPASGNAFDKLSSNDGDSTYIATTSAWSIAEFNLPDFAGTIGANSTVTVCMWVITKGSMAGPGKLLFGMTSTNSSTWYDSSIVRRASTYSANVYQNRSITEFRCPWTGLNWTSTTINQIYLWISFNAIGTLRFTEIGLLINVTTPGVEGMTDAQALLFVSLILGLGMMLYATARKSYVFEVFAGLVWLFSALFVYPGFGENPEAWTILILGLGMILLVHGVINLPTIGEAKGGTGK